MISILPIMIFTASMALLLPASATEDLLQSYFGVDVPAGPNTELPGDGSTQAIRMLGVGTQNYLCQRNEPVDDTAGPTYSWDLQFPLANLWVYDSDGSVDTSREPDGVHYFANIGSGAGWDLGTKCSSGTSPIDGDQGCESYTARWRGSLKASDPQPLASGNIAWLLVEKNEENMLPMVEGEAFNQFWIYSWMQRLNTVGGQPRGTCESEDDVGKAYASEYSCDYILAFTPILFDEDAPEDVQIPSNCFQTLPLKGEGVQEYQFWDGAWILSQPIATLRAYSTRTLQPIPDPDGLVGSHYFANVGDSGTPGSGAGWVIGKNCTLDTCTSMDGSWRGVLEAGVPNPDGEANINLFFVDRDDANTASQNNFLFRFEWMQRLNTVEGVPPVTAGQQGERFSSFYTCDYVLSLCLSDNPSGMEPGTEPIDVTSNNASEGEDSGTISLKSFTIFAIICSVASAGSFFLFW